MAGTGPNGRIIAADVQEFTPKAKAAPKVSEHVAEREAASESVSVSAASQAEWAAQSKREVPHYYLTVPVRVDAALSALKRLNEGADVQFGLEELVLKAAAVAMKAVPAANSEWRKDTVREHQRVHINVGNALVEDVGGIGLKAIAQARQKDSEGRVGTFSVAFANVQQFAAVVRPPQATVLAVGAVEDMPRLIAATKEGEVNRLERVPTLRVTLSCDHRVIDGAVGAQWLQVFKGLLEDPLRLIL